MFLVLAAQYESWSLPLAVILVVPMCLLCSCVGVNMAHMDINIFTQVGFIVLVGLACKNAILIVEFAKAQHEAGSTLKAATLEACELRLRPIMMTSLAFILGVVPLMVSEGAGAEMRKTLGTAVFSGMLGVTLFGIFLTPVFYFVIQWFSDKRAESRKREPDEDDSDDDNSRRRARPGLRFPDATASMRLPPATARFRLPRMSRIEIDVARAPTVHVVLVEPEIAANTGSVGRTCVAIGAMLWLVRPLGFHVNDQNIRRAGLDYWEHLTWRVVDHLDEVASELGHDRLWLFSTKADQLYTNVSYQSGRCSGFRTREPRPSNLVVDRAPGPRRPDPDPSGGSQPEPLQRRGRRRLRSDAPDRTIWTSRTLRVDHASGSRRTRPDSETDLHHDPASSFILDDLGLETFALNELGVERWVLQENLIRDDQQAWLSGPNPLDAHDHFDLVGARRILFQRRGPHNPSNSHGRLR